MAVDALPTAMTVTCGLNVVAFDKVIYATLKNMQGISLGIVSDTYISRSLMRHHVNPDLVGSVQTLQSPHGPFRDRRHQTRLRNSQTSW